MAQEQGASVAFLDALRSAEGQQTEQALTSSAAVKMPQSSRTLRFALADGSEVELPVVEGKGFYAELCASLGGEGTSEAIPLPFNARPAQMLAEWLAYEASQGNPEADAVAAGAAVADAAMADAAAAAADPWLAAFLAPALGDAALLVAALKLANYMGSDGLQAALALGLAGACDTAEKVQALFGPGAENDPLLGRIAAEAGKDVAGEPRRRAFVLASQAGPLNSLDENLVAAVAVYWQTPEERAAMEAQRAFEQRAKAQVEAQRAALEALASSSPEFRALVEAQRAFEAAQTALDGGHAAVGTFSVPYDGKRRAPFSTLRAFRPATPCGAFSAFDPGWCLGAQRVVSVVRPIPCRP